MSLRWMRSEKDDHWTLTRSLKRGGDKGKSVNPEPSDGGATKKTTEKRKSIKEKVASRLSGRMSSKKENTSSTTSSSSKKKEAKVNGKTLPGHVLFHHPQFNRGVAHTKEERDRHGLHGLLPPVYEDMDKQARRELAQLRKKNSPIEKYIHLINVLDRNSDLFYKILCDNIKEIMPIVYTPTVGQACLDHHSIWGKPRGLYISIEDSGNVANIVKNWPEDDVRAIVFSDGERILGLGDLSANGMPIPVGKLQLYTACAGIAPQHCLPVIIDVGTNNKTLLEDEFYMGLRHERVRGEKFDNLIFEFMEACKDRFGDSVLLQFEDFGNSTAFHLLEKTRDEFCTFNDDIQGTAAVSLAGIMSSLRLTSQEDGGAQKLSDHKFLFLGAGEAGTGIANLIAHAIVHEEGVTMEEARKQIYLVDSKGLITSTRTNLVHHKLDFAHELTDEDLENVKGTDFEVKNGEITSFEQAVRALKPTAIIGVSAIPQTFTQPIIEFLAETVARPLIFSLSNPTSKSECTAEQAYTWSNGKAIFASGSPFDPVTMTVDGTKKTFVPGQGNNAYIFPGLGLGVLASQARIIPDELFYVTAKALADQVSDDDLASGCLYPPLENIREVSSNIAVEVCKSAYDLDLAMADRPPNMQRHIRDSMWYPEYENKRLSKLPFSKSK